MRESVGAVERCVHAQPALTLARSFRQSKISFARRGLEPVRTLVARSGGICTPSAWSPDGKWISYRFTDEAYWRNKERMAKVYAEKPADKRPVWVIRPDGTEARVIECLRFQCAMDGSRASWKPRRRRCMSSIVHGALIMSGGIGGGYWILNSLPGLI